MSGDGFVFVYSMTDRHSFEAISSFVQMVRNATEKYAFPAVLVANKSDMKEDRVVTTEEGLEMAASIHASYLEVRYVVVLEISMFTLQRMI
jgi:GTPase KRas protein